MQVQNTAMTRLGLETSFTVQDCSLPRLRFEQGYLLSVRAVDLACNGPSLREAPALETAFPEHKFRLPNENYLTYCRFEPINPPELVLRQLYHPSGNLNDPNAIAFSEGESLERLVISMPAEHQGEQLRLVVQEYEELPIASPSGIVPPLKKHPVY